MHIQINHESARKIRRSSLASKWVSFGVCFGILLLFAVIMYFSTIIIDIRFPAATDDISFDELDISLDSDTGLGEGIGCGDYITEHDPNALTLQGNLYDLRRNCPAGHAYNGVLARFLHSWDEAALAPFCRSAAKQHAAYFYQPSVRSTYAPKAFQCDDVSQHGGWVCVYRGRVRAPKSGKFRFIGTGDDYLGVRFNNEVVLQAGYLIPSLFEEPGVPTHHLSGMQSPGAAGHKVWNDVKAGKVPALAGQELVQVKGCDVWNRELGGLVAGKVFSVKEGEVYPIQVVISEVPGGAFGCMLLIEDVTNGKNPKGAKYDLFRTNFNMPNKAQYFGLVEASNFKATKELNEQQIKEGKLTEDKRLKDDVYDKFSEAIEKLSQDLLDGKANDETPLPGAGKWNNYFFRGARPRKIGDIQAPEINEDSPIWTAVP